MTIDAVWNVPGVDPSTRDVVIEAARQSGVSVGEWLRLVVAEAEQLEPFSDAGAAPADLPGSDGIEPTGERPPIPKNGHTDPRPSGGETAEETGSPDPDEHARLMVEGDRNPARTTSEPFPDGKDGSGQHENTSEYGDAPAMENRDTLNETALRSGALAAVTLPSQTELTSVRSDFGDMLDVFANHTRLNRARLDILGEEVAALRRSLQDQWEPTAIARLESRIEEFSETVDAVMTATIGASRGASVARLEEKTDVLVARIDALVSHAPDVAAFNQMTAEIAAMRDVLAERRLPETPAADGEADEAVASGNGPGEAADQTAPTDAQPASTEGEQSESTEDEQQALFEAAGAAALETVRQLSVLSNPTDADAQIISDLTRDLEALYAAAGGSQDDRRAAIESFDLTMTRATDQLDRLEAEAGDETERHAGTG